MIRGNHVSALVLGLTLLTVVLTTTGCQLSTPAANRNTSSEDGSGIISSSGNLSINPTSQLVVGGSTLQFATSGGSGSYSYYISSGLGSIDQNTGVFTAPSTNGTTIVTVRDSNGLTASATLTVTGGLSVTFTPANPVPGSVITLTMSGGVAVYYPHIVSGGGTITGYTYTVAPKDAGTTITLQVTDSSATPQTFNLQIPIGGTAVSATVFTQTAYVLANSYIGVTLDNAVSGQLNPALVFFGTGSVIPPSGNAAYPSSIGAGFLASCQVPNVQNLQGACVARIPLPNLLNGATATTTYEGTLFISGQGSGAYLQYFCIDPNNTQVAFLQASSYNLAANIRYNTVGLGLLDARAFQANYEAVGAGFATVSITKAGYTTNTTCFGAGYTDATKYIQAMAQ